MNILVIGGTGFIGPHVVRRLAAEGHDVTLFHRGKSTADLPAEVGHIYGDRLELGSFRGHFLALRPDVVLDMRALVEADGRVVVETLTGITPRLVTISSVDVYRAYGRLIGTEPGPLEPTPLTESSPLREKRYPYRRETPPAADDPRAWTHDYDKIPIEELTMGTDGLAGTVLRLPMVYGEGDYQHRLLPYVQRMTDNRPAIILGERQARFQAPRGYVGNVAAAIALAVTDERASSRVFNVGDERAYTEREWVGLIKGVMGWPGSIEVVPDADLPASMRDETNAAQHLAADTSAIRRDLGFTDPFDLDTSLRHAIEWERQALATEPADYADEDAVLASRK